MRPRLNETELSAIIDALELRIELAKQIWVTRRNELSWQRYYRLEKTITWLECLKDKLKASLNRYSKSDWCTNSPILDLVLRKEFETRS